ncbi:hypothetical protein AB0M46_30235 [Dactylosporangium sp. NPDC051485]|uniref:hypothetical protein n=1 Tax=Dactylosporangium sp. NPDC051485 TaxID=3154846 RepID=UPI003427612B
MVADTLTQVVSDDVHVERLLNGARASGIRYRRRRRLTIVAATALAVAAVGTAGALAAAMLPATGNMAAAPTPITDAPSAPPSVRPTATAADLTQTMTQLPALPPAADAPSALSDPAQVGRPLLIHLGLDVLPFPVRNVQYLASSDGERLYLQGKAATLTVRLSRSTTDFEPLAGTQQPVVVNGHPGKFAYDESHSGIGTLRWRVANGLWLQVSGSLDRTAALAVGNGVRLDRTYRCAVPFRLPSTPAGTRVESCTMTMYAGPARGAGLTIATGGSYVTFTTDSGYGAAIREPNETLGSRPAEVIEHPGDKGRPILEINFAPEADTMVLMTAEGSYNGSVVRELAATLQWLGGSDPATWPENPVAP